MGKIVKRQVCKCHNCGNEAEMVVTCSLPDHDEHPAAPNAPSAAPAAAAPKKVKGQASCTHCGNEADMWIEL